MSFLRNIKSSFRRYQLPIIAVLLLGAVFIYYFTVIIYQNESRIRQRSFRGLAIVAENIQKEIKSFAQNNSKNFWNDYKKWVPIRKDFKAKIEANYGLKMADSVTLVQKKYSDTDFFTSYNNHQWTLNFRVPQTKENVFVYANAEAFLQPLLRKDLFEKYVVMADSAAIYENIAGSFNPLLSDSLKNNGALQKEKLFDVEAEGESFKLFMVPFFVEKEEWWIGGLIPYARYKNEKMSLSGNVIMLLTFFLFLSFLSFPFLKAFLMNKEEHLNSKDIVFSLLSFHLFAALLVVASWNIYTYHSLFRSGKDQQLKELADQIKNSFEKETKAALQQLQVANHLLDTMKMLPGDTVDIFDITNSPKFLKKNGKPFVNLDKAWDSLLNIYPFENIIWADSTGMQQRRWTKYPYVSEKVMIRDRPYFQKALNEELWKNPSGKGFYLDAIKSWVADKKLAIISTPVDTATKRIKDSLKYAVTGIAMQFQSVFKPVIPYGLEFCIINEEGKVYFHSHQEHDLYEDLLLETGKDAILAAAIKNRSHEYFNAYYYGDYTRFNIIPVDNMPLYVVTFYDILNLNGNNASMLSAITILIFLQLLFIFSTAILIQFLRSRRTKTAMNILELTWLRPDKKFSMQYIKHIWIFVFIALLELLSTQCLGIKPKPDNSMFIPGVLFTGSILAVMFSYILLCVDNNKDQNGSKKSKGRNPLSIIPLIIVSLLYLFVVILFSINLIRTHSNRLAVFLLIQFLFIFIPFIIIRVTLSPAKVIAAIGRAAIINFFIPKNYLEENQLYKTLYLWSHFTFVLATSIIPAALFYHLCYNQEVLLMAKNQQLYLAQYITKQDKSSEVKTSPTGNDFTAIYYKNIVADSISHEFRSHNSAMFCRNCGFPTVYRELRPSYTSYLKAIEVFTSPKSYDTAYKWFQSGDSLILQTLGYGAATSKKKTDSIEIASSRFKLKPPGWNKYPGTHTKEGRLSYVFLFYLICIFATVALFLLMQKFIYRVFFPDLPNINPVTTDDFKKILSKPSNQHLLIVGISDCGKKAAIENTLKEKLKIPVTDITWIDGTTPGKWNDYTEKEQEYVAGEKTNPQKGKQYILFQNFEYCLHDDSINDEKLKLLEKLLRSKACIILFSTTQSFPFLDEHILSSDKTADEGETKAQKIAERWINVMNNFQIFFYKSENRNIKVSQHESNNHSNKILQEVLASECTNSDFLYKLSSNLKTQAENKNTANQNNLVPAMDEDDILIKISQVATNYYDSIWLSLSLPEQKTLYDLAKDGLVNNQNNHEISLLLQKGVFKYDNGHLEIMNKSFRHYLLSRLKQEHITRIQSNEIQKGSWNKLRNLIVIIIVVVGVFIFATQQQAFNNLLTYLATFSGGILALLNIVNKVPGGSK
jgi:hypothetical protein